MRGSHKPTGFVFTGPSEATAPSTLPQHSESVGCVGANALIYNNHTLKILGITSKKKQLVNMYVIGLLHTIAIKPVVHVIS